MCDSSIRVLLISPRYDDASIPPFGVAYLAGFLRKQAFVDLTVVNADEHSLQEIEETVGSADYDVFATGGLITCIGFCQHLFALSAATNPDARRIVGGPLTVLNPTLLMRHLPVDFAVLGEGEETLSELLDVLRQHGDVGSVAGIVYRDRDNRIKATGRRTPIDLGRTDLEPDWSFVDLERYITFPDARGFFYNRLDSSRAYRTGYVMAGRGCPFRCAFCGSPLGGFRKRTHENIIREMRQWRDNYDVDHIRFINETLFSSPSDIQSLCQKIIEQELGMRWSCSLRVDIVDRASLTLMKQAGCDYIIYGVESGSDRILKRMNKHTTVERNRAALRVTREAGIYPDVAVMFGYCDETLEEMQDTVDFVLEDSNLPESLAITTAMPGTKLYTELVANGLIRDEWEYVNMMCSELAKGSISGDRRPILNCTGISDEIYWPSILSEKRRLLSTHYLRNRAEFLESESFRGHVLVRVRCPECGSEYQSDMPYHRVTIEKLFCKQCLRYIWSDYYMVSDELTEHFEKVRSFLRRTREDGKALVLYIPGDVASASRLAEVDPWNLIWGNVTAIVGDIDEFSCYEVVRPEAARELAPAPVLVMDADNSVARARLVRMGFSADEMLAVLPRVPARYRARQWLVAQMRAYCPETLKPLARRLILGRRRYPKDVSRRSGRGGATQ